MNLWGVALSVDAFLVFLSLVDILEYGTRSFQVLVFVVYLVHVVQINFLTTVYT